MDCIDLGSSYSNPTSSQIRFSLLYGKEQKEISEHRLYLIWQGKKSQVLHVKQAPEDKCRVWGCWETTHLNLNKVNNICIWFQGTASRFRGRMHHKSLIFIHLFGRLIFFLILNSSMWAWHCQISTIQMETSLVALISDYKKMLSYRLCFFNSQTLRPDWAALFFFNEGGALGYHTRFFTVCPWWSCAVSLRG